jgi:protein-S-isoprenylcysteine O-methyltransferase Ste14
LLTLLALIIGLGAGLIALFIRFLIGLLVEEGWLRAFFRGRKVTKIIVPEG